MGNATCAVEGCEEPVMAKGYCSPHYGRWRRHGDPLAGGVPRRSYRGVDRPPCAVDGCEDPVKARGWCSDHYQRWRAHGDPEGGRARPGSLSGGPCSVEDCGELANGGLGWCKRHYQRWYNTGDPLTPDKYTRRGASLRERIEARIVKTDHCWFWTGSTNGDGYGCIGVTVDGVRKIRGAHRVSYEVFVGPIPDGLVIDHLCRNRACVRPDHLEPVLHEVNVQRGAAAAVPATHCRNNHEYTKANTRWVRVCIACSDAARERWLARKAA